MAGRKRVAFTLVEMLVALAIILMLAALTVTFLNFQEKKLATDGAGRLQGWLLAAQQWALRDQAPRGLRILPVSTTSPGAIATGPQTVTPASMNGILQGTTVRVDVGHLAETVQVTAPVTATTFNATFTQAHAAGVALVAPTLASSFQYIEQPDDFSGGYLSYDSTGGPPSPVWTGYATFDKTGPVEDFAGGFYGYDSTNYPVQAGDWIEFPGVGDSNANHVYRVEQVTGRNQLQVDRGADSSPQFTNNYRIVRAPRPRRAEAPVQLPDNIIVDLRTNGWYLNPLPRNPWTGSFDILFGPSGSVMGMGSGNDKIQLWVRDLREDQPGPGVHTFAGDQALVTVYVHTGMVRVSRVDTTPASPTDYAKPYAFTLESASTPP